jgi:hypothetical protein
LDVGRLPLLRLLCGCRAGLAYWEGCGADGGREVETREALAAEGREVQGGTDFFTSYSALRLCL